MPAGSPECTLLLRRYYGMCVLACNMVFMWPRFVHGTKAVDYFKKDFIVMFSWFFNLLLGMVVTWFFLFHCRLAVSVSIHITSCSCAPA